MFNRPILAVFEKKASIRNCRGIFAAVKMKRIKVLVISNYRETASVRPEAEMFIGLQKGGVDITVMTYGEAEYAEKFRAAGVRVINFHPEKEFDKRAVKFIREELTAGGYDVLHLFNSKAIINGIRAAKRLPVKVVLYRGFTGNVHWYDPAAYLKFLHPRVDKIVCLTPSVEAHFHRQLFFDKTKTAVIRKGHSPEWYASLQPADLTRLQIPENAFVVTCVANDRPIKGVPYFIRATYFLPPELPVHFVLIGKNTDAGKNKRLMEASPNKEKIHALGYRKDAQNIVAASHVLVLPSVKGEAMTKAVVEAMSLGVTPVITDTSGNQGLVLNEQCGLVVPPRNSAAIAAAILRLYNNLALCASLGAEAKKHIETHFHIRDTILKTKKLYEDSTGKRKSWD
jgi:glycosyltransferase involved in cell wall biosynthesis